MTGMNFAAAHLAQFQKEHGLSGQSVLGEQLYSTAKQYSPAAISSPKPGPGLVPYVAPLSQIDQAKSLFDSLFGDMKISPYLPFTVGETSETVAGVAEAGATAAASSIDATKGFYEGAAELPAYLSTKTDTFLEYLAEVQGQAGQFGASLGEGAQAAQNMSKDFSSGMSDLKSIALIGGAALVAVLVLPKVLK